LCLFVQFDKIFEPYTEYCMKQEACHEYIKLKMAENEQFRTFITVRDNWQFLVFVASSAVALGFSFSFSFLTAIIRDVPNILFVYSYSIRPE